MGNRKSEFLEVVTDMSQYAGALVGAAVIAGKKVICCLNDLTIVDTVLKPPADEDRTSGIKSCKTDMEVD